MESTTCNLCGADNSSPYARIPDLLLDRPQTHAQLVRCNHCGLIYQNPRPTPAEIGAHYPPSYESYADYRRTAQGRLMRLAYDYGMNKRCRFVTAAAPRGGRLLDVGCAAGSFLTAMRDKPGWEVEGVELSVETAQIARERNGLKVFAGTLEEAAFPDNHFAAVTLWDVLEHLHDPVGTLVEIRRILQPGGIVVIRVPNLASWDAAIFGQYWAGLDAPRHLYVYTPETLARSLTSGGVELIDQSTAIGSYPIFALNVRFWMNAHGIAPGTKAIVSKALYNPASRILSAPAFFLPSVLGVGPLLVATARKPVQTGVSATRLQE
jgi:SAM-dependent methyltransferase